ncbi:uncharacterized protein LOC113238688, partial [Hyposmocoma kahamanoa]|uniref:uncharacterized protein LOC113238688 n=1 Tax=Hyposmocoma kahamanoa TaxID=1477025 RepID=UPI000E6D7EE4
MFGEYRSLSYCLVAIFVATDAEGTREESDLSFSRITVRGARGGQCTDSSIASCSDYVANPDGRDEEEFIVNIRDQVISAIKLEIPNLLKTVIKNELAPLRNSFNELCKSVDFLSNKYDELCKSVVTVTEENSQLKKDNIELQSSLTQIWSRVNDLEQHLRENNLEIHGVPENRSENILTVVKQCASAIGHKVDDTDIVNYTRVAKQDKESYETRLNEFDLLTLERPRIERSIMNIFDDEKTRKGALCREKERIGTRWARALQVVTTSHEQTIKKVDAPRGNKFYDKPGGTEHNAKSEKRSVVNKEKDKLCINWNKASQKVTIVKEQIAEKVDEPETRNLCTSAKRPVGTENDKPTKGTLYDKLNRSGRFEQNVECNERNIIKKEKKALASERDKSQRVAIDGEQMTRKDYEPQKRSLYDRLNRPGGLECNAKCEQKKVINKEKKGLPTDCDKVSRKITTENERIARKVNKPEKESLYALSRNPVGTENIECEERNVINKEKERLTTEWYSTSQKAPIGNEQTVRKYDKPEKDSLYVKLNRPSEIEHNADCEEKYVINKVKEGLAPERGGTPQKIANNREPTTRKGYEPQKESLYDRLNTLGGIKFKAECDERNDKENERLATEMGRAFQKIAIDSEQTTRKDYELQKGSLYDRLNRPSEIERNAECEETHVINKKKERLTTEWDRAPQKVTIDNEQNARKDNEPQKVSLYNRLNRPVGTEYYEPTKGSLYDKLNWPSPMEHNTDCEERNFVNQEKEVLTTEECGAFQKVSMDSEQTTEKDNEPKKGSLYARLNRLVGTEYNEPTKGSLYIKLNSLGGVEYDTECQQKIAIDKEKGRLTPEKDRAFQKVTIDNEQPTGKDREPEKGSLCARLNRPVDTEYNELTKESLYDKLNTPVGTEYNEPTKESLCDKLARPGGMEYNAKQELYKAPQTVTIDNEQPTRKDNEPDRIIEPSAFDNAEHEEKNIINKEKEGIATEWDSVSQEVAIDNKETAEEEEEDNELEEGRLYTWTESPRKTKYHDRTSVNLYDRLNKIGGVKYDEQQRMRLMMSGTETETETETKYDEAKRRKKSFFGRALEEKNKKKKAKEVLPPKEVIPSQKVTIDKQEKVKLDAKLNKLDGHEYSEEKSNTITIRAKSFEISATEMLKIQTEAEKEEEFEKKLEIKIEEKSLKGPDETDYDAKKKQTKDVQKNIRMNAKNLFKGVTYSDEKSNMTTIRAKSFEMSTIDMKTMKEMMEEMKKKRKGKMKKETESEEKEGLEEEMEVKIIERIENESEEEMEKKIEKKMEVWMEDSADNIYKGTSSLGREKGMMKGKKEGNTKEMLKGEMAGDRIKKMKGEKKGTMKKKKEGKIKGKTNEKVPKKTKQKGKDTIKMSQKIKNRLKETMESEFVENIQEKKRRRKVVKVINKQKAVEQKELKQTLRSLKRQEKNVKKKIKQLKQRRAREKLMANIKTKTKRKCNKCKRGIVGIPKKIKQIKPKEVVKTMKKMTPNQIRNHIIAKTMKKVDTFKQYALRKTKELEKQLP